MRSTEILNMIALLLGGLTFFLFGMSVMSGGLEEMAGGNLEKTLKKVGKNDLSGFALGAGITVAIQSSSAMTVMLVGLVNSGILDFSETFGMIMGSHVGTTLTAWILTLNANSGNSLFMALLRPMTFAPILAFFGIMMRMFSKNRQRRKLGDIFIGFAVLMAGMDMMSSSMADVKQFAGILTLFSKYPIVAFLASTLFTGLIQSSAATVAIVQAMALTTNMDLKIAIPLVIGANIGTCMTSLISSIGTNKGAKRVVAMHVYSNTIGGSILMAALYIVMIFSPGTLDHTVNIFTVAIIHSCFNIFNTILFTPLKKPLFALCRKTVRQTDEKEHTVFLDERLFYNTPLALFECKRLCNEMAELTRTSVNKALAMVFDYNEKTAEEIAQEEALVDKYEDRLGTYLVRLSGNSLNEEDRHAVARLLHSLSDFERISDHALNLCDVSKEIMDKEIEFSLPINEGIKNITGALSEIINLTCDVFIADDHESASHIEPLEQVIDALGYELKSLNIDSLQKGEGTTTLGFVLSDILTNYERISDHCSNLAVFTAQLNTPRLDAHNYLNNVKNMNNPDFANDFNRFLAKYGGK
ncbi:MAG: Na/Pi cotransporter family protein [Clostridia bacterium]|nr:Na/Pi cotransporter family protein [Clostridia bacterium]